MSTDIRGIDASTFQNVIDWAAVKASGQVHFAYARATYGVKTVDDQFMRNHDVARERDIPIGSYHFYLHNGTPGEQAEFFIRTCTDRLGTLVPMIDIEEGSFLWKPGGTMAVQAAIDGIGTFVRAVLQATGLKKMLGYTNYDTWMNYLGGTKQLADILDLWLAQTEDPRDGLFGGWTDWLLWQDSTTTVPGIEGAVDLDILNPAHTLADITR